MLGFKLTALEIKYVTVTVVNKTIFIFYQGSGE